MIKAVDPRILAQAIKAFQDSFDMPDNLPNVNENSVVSFPHELVIRGKIVPINYDRDTNTITYRGE